MKKTILALALLLAAVSVGAQTGIATSISAALPEVVSASSMPSSPATNRVVLVYDAASSSVCTGTGTTRVWCVWTGAAWVPIGGGGGGAITVEEADGSPSVNPTTILQFDQADGFSVVDEGAGQAQVDFAPATDSVGIDALDDDLNSPSAGDFVVVEIGGVSFDFVTPDAGTDVAADLEEEDHAAEHADGAADELAATNLASPCTDLQVLGGTAVVGGVECQVDDVGTDTLDDLSDDQIGALLDVSETGADIGEALLNDGAGAWAPSAATVCLSTDVNCPSDEVGVASVADGTGIDGTAGEGGTYTPTLDPTEVGDLTWGDNSDASVVQAVDPTGTTNPAWTYTDGSADLTTGTLKQGGAAVILEGDSRLSDARTPTAHASSHEDAGGDEVSVAALSGRLADPQGVYTHATDCTALTTGVSGDLCVELDADELYSCQPTAGGCDTPGEWILTGDGGGGGNAFTTIGVATADTSTDDLTVTDSSTIDFVTTNDPEDLTASFLPAGVGDATWADGTDASVLWTVNQSGIVIGDPTVAFGDGTITVGGPAGTSLVLPSQNDKTSPTLCFGDCDTGILEAADDVVLVSVDSKNHVTFTTGYTRFWVNDSSPNNPSIRHEVSLATNPVYTIDHATVDTGIGGTTTGSDLISLIVAGVGAFQVVHDGTSTTTTAAGTALQASNVLQADADGDATMNFFVDSTGRSQFDALDDGTPDVFIEEGTTGQPNIYGTNRLRLGSRSTTIGIDLDNNYTQIRGNGLIIFNETTSGNDLKLDAGLLELGDGYNLAWEGATDDDIRFTMSATDPTSAHVIDWPDDDLANLDIFIGDGAGSVAYVAAPSGGTDGCSNGTTDKVLFQASTRTWSCGTDAGAGGGMTSFDVQGDDGAPNVTITDGNTLVVSGGSGITTEDGDAGADTLSIACDAAAAATPGCLELDNHLGGTAAAPTVVDVACSGSCIADAEVDSDLTIDQTTAGTFTLDLDDPLTNEGRIGWDAAANRIRVGETGGVVTFYSGDHFAPTAGVATDHGATSVTEADLASEDYGDFTCGAGADDCDLNSGVVDTTALADGSADQVDVDDTDTLAGNPDHGADSVWFATTGLIFEGLTAGADTNEGLLKSADISGGDKTWTLPNETGTICTDGSVCSGYEPSGSYSGVGGCTNQFARTLNDAAAPTCETVLDTDAEASFVHTDEASTWASAGTQVINDPLQVYPDGTNGVQVSAAGLLSKTGTGSVQADDVVCTTCVGAGEFGAQSIDGDDVATTVAGRSLTMDTAATPDEIDADVELYEHTKCINVDPTATATDWLFFRADGIPIVFDPGGTDCGTLSTTGTGGGAIYLTNGERDYAVLLAVFGFIDGVLLWTL